MSRIRFFPTISPVVFESFNVRDHRSLIAIAAAVALSAVLAISRIDTFQVGAFSDDAHYIVLAEALASGEGYQLTSYPVPVPEYAFPPGWPLMLAGFVRLFPDNFRVLQLLSLALWLATIVLISALFRSRLPYPYWLFVLVVTAVSPSLVGMSTMVMSESAYTFFSVLAVVLWERWETCQSSSNRSHIHLVATVILTVWVTYIRSVGFSLLLAMYLLLLWTRRVRQLGAAFVISTVALLPQVIVNIKSGGGLVSPGYEQQVFQIGALSDKLSHILSNLHTYLISLVPNAIIPVFGPRLAGIVGTGDLSVAVTYAPVLVVIPIVVGMTIIVSSLGPRLPEIYVFAYFATINLFWNPAVGSAQARFLIPIMPFLFLYLFVGICAISGFGRFRSARLPIFVSAFLVTILIIVSLARNIQGVLDPLRSRITDLESGSVWIKENTEPNSIIMTPDPVSRYLYLRRKTVGYPDEPEFELFLARNCVDYVITAPSLTGKDVALPVPHVGLLRPEYSNPAESVAVYSVARNGDACVCEGCR